MAHTRRSIIYKYGTMEAARFEDILREVAEMDQVQLLRLQCKVEAALHAREHFPEPMVGRMARPAAETLPVIEAVDVIVEDGPLV